MTSIAIVPAAGAGRRFGPAQKLLAPIDGLPLLERTIRSLLEAPVTGVIVVLAPAVALPGIAALDDSRVHTAVNPDPSRGMLSSIQAGVVSLFETGWWSAERDECGDSRSVAVIQPGDMPFVSPQTVQRVIEACQARGQVVCPTFGSERGHPVVVPGALLEAIRRASEGTTLAAILDRFPGGRATLEVSDPGVIRDVDVPADL